jgi:signal transduction histidine kinase
LHFQQRDRFLVKFFLISPGSLFFIKNRNRTVNPGMQGSRSGVAPAWPGRGRLAFTALLLLALAIAGRPAGAQPDAADTLTEAARLNRSAQLLVRTDPAAALRDAARALDLAENSGQESERAAAYRNMALVRLYLLRDFRDALEHCRQAQEIESRTGNYAGAIATALTEAEILEASGDLRNALHRLGQAAHWSDSLGLAGPRLEALLRSADLNQTVGSELRARAMLSEAAALAGAAGDQQMKARATLAQGRLERRAGGSAPALRHLEEAAGQFRQLRDAEGEARALFETGEAWRQSGDSEKARTSFLRSVQLQQQGGNIRGQAGSLIALAQLFLEGGQYEAALQSADSALHLAEQVNDNRIMYDAFTVLAGSYASLGQGETARDFREKSARMGEQVLDELLYRHHLEGEARAQMAELDLRLAQEEMNEETGRKITLMRGYLFLAILVIIILAVGSVAYYRHVERLQAKTGQELLQVQEQLKQQAASLHSLQRTQERLIYFLDEGLKNPVSVLRSYSSLLRNNRELVTPESAVNIGAGLEDAMGTMLHFLRNLKLWGRIQAGLVRLNREEFNLTALIGELYAEFRPAADEKKVRLELLAEPEVMVWADRKAMALVFRNLLSNALRFSPAGEVISVFADEWKDRVDVGVRDNGEGMGDEVKKRLLDPLGGHPKPDREQRPGSGFGFAIARDFLNLHRATVAIDSRPGGGTTVRFTLPKKGFKGHNPNPFKS